MAFCVAPLSLLGACGEVRYEGDPAHGAAPHTAGAERPASDEVNELLAELLASRICQRALGSFVGLPGDGGQQGAAAGSDPAVGRWWIRECSSEAQGEHLSVTLSGPGWTWVDRETSGFRVRQYLRFDARAQFSASLQVGYDRSVRIATIWMQPEQGVAAEITPRGLVRAEATGLISSIVGGVLGLAGSSPSDQARAQAAEQGSTQLRDRLSAGFTATYALDGEQMDFMIGRLPRGVTPERPWPAGEEAWLINERAQLWPGGMHVIGPIDPAAGALEADLELEEGQGVILRRICAQPLTRFLDDSFAGAEATLPAGEMITELTVARRPTRLHLDAADCRSLWVITPQPGASISSTFRYRIASAHPAGGQAQVGPHPRANVEPAAAQRQATAQGTAPETPVASQHAIRLQIQSVSVTADDGDDGSWDLLGGAPDLYVSVRSVATGRDLDRSPTVEDQHEVHFERWLPGAVHLEDFPLRFLIFDADLTTDALVGFADLDASALQGAGQLSLDIRRGGARPVQTGVLRLRVSPVD